MSRIDCSGIDARDSQFCSGEWALLLMAARAKGSKILAKRLEVAEMEQILPSAVFSLLVLVLC